MSQTQQQLRQPSLEDIKDEATRRSLQWVKDYLEQIELLKGQFQFFELTFKRNDVGLKIPHSLGFVPVDFIVTSTVGTGTLTLNYNKMDKEFFNLTTAGTSASDPLVVRFFAGRYQK